MSNKYAYAGFWIRLLASIIDSIIMVVVLIPLAVLVQEATYRKIIWLRFK